MKQIFISYDEMQLTFLIYLLFRVSENEYLFFDAWYYKVIHYLSVNRLDFELIPAEFPDEHMSSQEDSRSLEF